MGGASKMTAVAALPRAEPAEALRNSETSLGSGADSSAGSWERGSECSDIGDVHNSANVSVVATTPSAAEHEPEPCVDTPAPEAVVETPVPAETAEPSEETPVEQSTEDPPEVPVLAHALSSVDVDNVLEASNTPTVVEPAQTSIQEIQEAQETEKLDEPAKPVVKKPALPSKKKSKVVAKSRKPPAKKQPKTIGALKKKAKGKSRGRSLAELSKPKVVKQQSLEAPKKKTRGKSRGKSLEELSKPRTIRERPKTNSKSPKKKPTAKKPKLESKLTRGKSLEELEEASSLLTKKIHRMSSLKDEAHLANGYDLPSVKKLGKRLLTLSKKLRTIAAKKYELRTNTSFKGLSKLD